MISKIKSRGVAYLGAFTQCVIGTTIGQTYGTKTQFPRSNGIGSIQRKLSSRRIERMLESINNWSPTRSYCNGTISSTSKHSTAKSPPISTRSTVSATTANTPGGARTTSRTATSWANGKEI